MINNDTIKLVADILSESELTNVELSYILTLKNKDYDETRAIVYDINDPSKIYEINTDGVNSVIHSLPDWDFNFDDNMLYDLQGGYEFVFATLEAHCGLWNAIAESKYEIQYEKGLQKYLKYCKDNYININTLNLVSPNIHDISDMYIEENVGYKIIANMEIGKGAVVLGYKKGAPSEYVTWLTTTNRDKGYDLGHYHTSYEAAIQDYKDRTHKLVDEGISALCINRTQKYKKSKNR